MSTAIAPPDAAPLKLSRQWINMSFAVRDTGAHTGSLYGASQLPVFNASRLQNTKVGGLEGAANGDVLTWDGPSKCWAATAAQPVFYRGHLAHNDSPDVRFHIGPNGVDQSPGDFVVDASDTRRLLVKKKGVYSLTISDGYQSSADVFFRINSDKPVYVLNPGGGVPHKLESSSSNWRNFSITEVMAVSADTTLTLGAGVGAILDGREWSYFIMYRLFDS